MRRRVLAPILAISAIVCVVLAYWLATRTGDDRPGPAEQQAAAVRVEPDVNPASGVDQSSRETAVVAEQQPATQEAADSSQVVSPEAVPRLIADATSGDAEKRAAAIGALGRAPKSEALPVLRRIVNSGEPQVDRPLALRSLRDLALNQGDEDGGIRTVVREVIYHGDDESLAGAAQETLDIIEESELK
jgi:hypothetical protein